MLSDVTLVKVAASPVCVIAEGQSVIALAKEQTKGNLVAIKFIKASKYNG